MNKPIDPAFLNKWNEEADDVEEEPYFELDGNGYRLFEEWRDIVLAAGTNVALQDLLDQVKMVYKLTKIK